MVVPDEEARSRVQVSEGSGEKPRTLAPDVAFKIIGNETRLTILDTLWGSGRQEPMAFAELRKIVGMQDGSQFNYHLRKLLEGGFIGKVGGRYHIRQPGARVVATVRTGYLTNHPVIDPFETTGACYACESPLHARYADELFFVECSVCDQLHSLGWFPPNALEGRTPAEALLAFEVLTRATRDLAIAGICPICNGRMNRTLARDWSDVPVGSSYLDPELDGALSAWYVCSHCNAWVSVTPGEAIIDHPAVVKFHREHDIDVLARPGWELPWTVDESVLDVVSDEPFRVQITIALEGEKRTLTLDEEFDVVAVEQATI